MSKVRRQSKLIAELDCPVIIYPQTQEVEQLLVHQSNYKN
jgi:hypothetical protein